jgi:hypothetical protein
MLVALHSMHLSPVSRAFLLRTRVNYGGWKRRNLQTRQKTRMSHLVKRDGWRHRNVSFHGKWLTWVAKIDCSLYPATIFPSWRNVNNRDRRDSFGLPNLFSRKILRVLSTLKLNPVWELIGSSNKKKPVDRWSWSVLEAAKWYQEMDEQRRALLILGMHMWVLLIKILYHSQVDEKGSLE